MPALVTRLGLMPALVLGLGSGNAISATPLKETVQGFIPPEGRALGSEIHGPIQGSIPSEEVAMGSWFTLNVHDLWEKSPTNSRLSDPHPRGTGIKPWGHGHPMVGMKGPKCQAGLLSSRRPA